MESAQLTVADKAIEILRQTRNGDTLEPRDLKLVEMAVNDFLNEGGKQAFETLFSSVASGGYASTPHWFHGIENMTRDQQGYVYWKGKQIEHYSHSDPSESRRDALELAERCRALEGKGFPVSGSTLMRTCVMEAPADTPWLLALQRYYCFFEPAEEVGPSISEFHGIFYRIGADSGVVVVSRNAEGVQIIHKDSAYDAFHDLQGRGLKSLPVDPDYEEMCRRLTLMAVTPAALEAAISGA
ncbi:hypothetical protein ParKJ_23210 [Paraburkholderia fungorum]|uniref:Uncharacterized protein n=1 Tax=Paraburkholderia fungorum TaxID=134537 RepID=A0AAP5QBX9_9BURK|nr:hypothetical protein [Paraburkholderia fungorum]MDT8840339.1 hypothetical protein [Paraburkholderia fungorum]